METGPLGHDEEDCGFEVIDEHGNRHTFQVGLDGEINFHGTDDYPHKREDRTDEEQRFMSQVEVRALYAAQKEFSDADILPFEYDPDELEKVASAIQTHPEDAYEQDFRAFYDAIQEPPVDRPREEVDVVLVGVRLGEAFETIEQPGTACTRRPSRTFSTRCGSRSSSCGSAARPIPATTRSATPTRRSTASAHAEFSLPSLLALAPLG